jgi:hypothetical protein
MIDALADISELFESVTAAAKDADAAGDATARLEAYGEVERARGVLLAFRAARETHEATDTPDGADTLSDRLQAAVDALRGRETPDRDNPPLDEIAATARDASDVIESRAATLNDTLADEIAPEADAPRGFE